MLLYCTFSHDPNLNYYTHTCRVFLLQSWHSHLIGGENKEEEEVGKREKVGRERRLGREWRLGRERRLGRARKRHRNMTSSNSSVDKQTRRERCVPFCFMLLTTQAKRIVPFIYNPLVVFVFRVPTSSRFG